MTASLHALIRVLAAILTVQSGHAAGVTHKPKTLPAPIAVPKQGTPSAPQTKDANAPASPQQEPAPPAYEPQLLRLGEILGTLSYLRELCGDGDGPEWRSRMSALIDAEGVTEQRKERLAGAFNRGFRGYQYTYHACTAGAQTVIRRLLDEGERITRDVASRYAG